MFETLRSFLKTDFEKELFNEAFKNLNNKESKIRHCNFAYALRSLIDCIFDERISEENIKNAPWYKKESNERDITRRQRYKYFIQGDADDYFINEIIKFDSIDKISNKFNKAIHKLSKYTHITSKTFNISDSEINLFIENIDRVSAGFFDSIVSIKAKLIEKLELWLYESINDTFISTTIQEIDERCTHYSIDYIDVNSIEILNKDDSSYFFDISTPFEIEAEGDIEVEHQFGSDGDCRRGDGLRFNESYPYKVRFRITIPSIREIIGDEKEYDSLANYSEKQKNKLDKLFMDEFYRNVELIDYKVQTFNYH